MPKKKIGGMITRYVIINRLRIVSDESKMLAGCVDKVIVCLVIRVESIG